MGNLVVLLSMPRSGSTWLGKIFDSQPRTLYRHEPESGGRLNAIPLAPEKAQSQAYRSVLEEFVEELPMMRATKVTASMPVFPKRYYSPLKYHIRRGLIAGAKLAAKGLGEVAVPDPVDYRRHPEVVLVWKSIESAGRLGVLAELLPQVRIIHLIRHPCGYVASVLRGESGHQFPGDEASAEDYELLEILLQTPQAQQHGLSMEALRRMSPVERLAWRWVLFNEKAMDEALGLDNCMLIRYEDLCQAPGEWAGKAFSFTGLEWDSQTDAFIRRSTSTSKEAYYSVYKNPHQAAYRWQEQLATEDIDRILSAVKGSAPGRLYVDSDPGQ